MIIIIAVIIEVLATVAVHFKYKKYNPVIKYSSASSTIFIVQKLLKKYGIAEIININSHDLVKSYPKPLFIPSETHGYTNRSGNFKLRFFDQINKNLYYETKVTILENGTRFVGKPTNIKSNVFIFGDSFIFGYGVNDEHTFTHLLQQKYLSYKFHLHAAPGWSLNNALLNIKSLKNEIRSDDIVILGYADFYKKRNIAAPSRIKQNKARQIFPEGLGHLRFWINSDNELDYEVLPYSCEDIKKYCEEADPSIEKMNLLTIRIINEIKSLVKAKVFLLHFQGEVNDPVLSALDPGITIIPATEDTFSYNIRDTIMGLDNHPGPVWHYSMYTLISKKISELIKN